MSKESKEFKQSLDKFIGTFWSNKIFNPLEKWIGSGGGSGGGSGVGKETLQGGEIFNDYENNKALGVNSHAEGTRTTAFGDNSHAEGFNFPTETTGTLNITNSAAVGQNTEITVSVPLSECVIIEEEQNVGIKIGNKVFNKYSIIKYNNEIYYVVNYWPQNEVYDDPQIVKIKILGNVTIPTGNMNFIFVEQGAIGTSSHAEGGHTVSAGQASHTEGYGSKVTYKTLKGDPIGAHAEGTNTVALGKGAHAEGGGSVAEGKYAHAEGDGSKALGSVSHAEGFETVASGDYSHAEGNYSEATEYCSHAEGFGTVASGDYSHAEGNYSEATEFGSHAEGESTSASSRSQHVQGRYNIKDRQGKYAHIVGNGSDNTVRSNAHTLDWLGNATFAGTVSSKGADYAEYFEWFDGNPHNEDRVGRAVTLDGEKIRYAEDGDDVLGIISGTAMVIGDNAEWEWKDKYKTDDFGRVIWKLEEEFIEVDGEKKSLGMFPHRELSENYNPEEKYTRRSDRKEWSTVGMFGKLHALDNGSCVVGGYAKVGMSGKLTSSKEKTNMKVMKRINDNIVLVLMK